MESVVCAICGAVITDGAYRMIDTPVKVGNSTGEDAQTNDYVTVSQVHCFKCDPPDDGSAYAGSGDGIEGA